MVQPHFHVDGVHILTTAGVVLLTLFIWNKTASYLVVSGGRKQAWGEAMASVTH